MIVQKIVPIPVAHEPAAPPLTNCAAQTTPDDNPQMNHEKTWGFIFFFG